MRIVNGSLERDSSAAIDIKLLIIFMHVKLESHACQCKSLGSLLQKDERR